MFLGFPTTVQAVSGSKGLGLPHSQPLRAPLAERHVSQSSEAVKSAAPDTSAPTTLFRPATCEGAASTVSGHRLPSRCRHWHALAASGRCFGVDRHRAFSNMAYTGAKGTGLDGNVFSILGHGHTAVYMPGRYPEGRRACNHSMTDGGRRSSLHKEFPPSPALASPPNVVAGRSLRRCQPRFSLGCLC